MSPVKGITGSPKLITSAKNLRTLIIFFPENIQDDTASSFSQELFLEKYPRYDLSGVV
jgi:hypothetical protein